VIEPDFPHGGDDEPIAQEIDGVAVALIDRGHFPAAEGDFQRIAGALSFDGHEKFLPVRSEPAEYGIGLLAIHHHRGFPRQGVTSR
jgi:hypothetical protein